MKTLLASLKMHLAAFRDDVRGSVSVEAALIFPMVMWALLSMFVFFEGYRQTAINHKAAETIADMLSRETENINPTYIDNTKQLFDLLAEANGATKIRITVAKWAKRHGAYRVVWSKKRGSGLSSLTHADLMLMESKLPRLPNQERIIIVETWSTFEPIFNVGLGDVDINTFVFTRLRFAPQLRYCGTCT